MVFQKPGRKSEKNLEEIIKILKTWKKFSKPGENFQKTFGHPVYCLFCDVETLKNLFTEDFQYSLKRV